jgi:3-carboxy-cis,cis-muconate cycloisomerase
LVGDAEIASFFSEEADLAAMLEFESALAAAEASYGFIPAAAASAIAEGIETFEVARARLTDDIARDGMTVPGLVSQLRAHVAETHRRHLHFGSTSQDAIDTSFMLRGKKAFIVLIARLDLVLESLERLQKDFGARGLMARTRMQRALPITVADRIRTWSAGVYEAREALKTCRFPLQFGGPVGTLGEFGDKGVALKNALAAELGLATLPYNWHAVRGVVVAMADACSLLTGALGKLGADYCLMDQNELGEVKLTGGGTSSAMHHKQNPVAAETLVTLARLNAILVSGMHHCLVHEQERSGAAWTLEWLLMPQVIVTAGASARIAHTLLETTASMGDGADT